MKLLTLVILFSTTSAFTAGRNIKLDMKISVNGEMVSDPKLVLSPGSTGTIIQEKGSDKYFIEVTAQQQESKSKDGRHAIAMKFNVGKIESDGSRTLLGSPRILGLENERAQITESDQAGHELLSVTVIPTQAGAF